MIYITYVNLNDIGHIGVKKKIISQIGVFKKEFGKVYLTMYSGQMFYLLEDQKIIEKKLAITKQICNEILIKWIEKYHIKRTYIRYCFADKWFLQFLKRQKEMGIKSVLEIPTYPYEGEVDNKRIAIEDNYYKDHLYKYIDYVATNSNRETVLGIKCITLFNGVDIEKNPLCKRKRKDNEIVLIGVSTLEIWHGYERILEGLHHYYKKPGTYKILFKIIGEGIEDNKYRSFASKYNLEQFVSFYGRLEGEQLNKQYDLSDLAVSSLGLFKTGIQNVTPIKGAEYCARGIPFICGYHDMRFDKRFSYIMEVSNDSNPINMYKVIDFYQKVIKKETYQNEMREYAFQHLTWPGVMASIIEALI